MPDADRQSKGRRIPVAILTGFLGSGKTTVLKHVLADPAMRGTAVLVNEFGEVGIDHLMVREVAEDVVLLDSGCLCCSIRGDMVAALRTLLASQAAGQISPVQRIVLETSGLADPAPILQTFMTDRLFLEQLSLAGVVTTVDAVLGLGQLEAEPESIKQIAVADRLLVTKCDLASADALEALRLQLVEINPLARLQQATFGQVDAASFFDAGLWNPATKRLDVQRWLNEEALGERRPVDAHRAGIQTFVVRFTLPLDWSRFADAASALLACHGERLLRVKGVLNIAGETQPVVIHGVQHIFHPPARLSRWPGGNRSSSIVFITRGVAQADVEAALRPALELAA